MSVAAEAAEPVLRLRGLSRHFGGVHAVRDVTLDVAHGERRAVLGPNGAGKSTLFNLIAGDDVPSSGSVELFGRDATAMPVRKRIRAGMTRTYQQSRLLAGLSVGDNLYLAVMGVGGGHLSLVRRPSVERERRAAVSAVAERIGMADSLDRVVGSLSHGERRVVGVGIALAGRPRLMLLDEPAAGLSPGERQRLTQLLLSLDRDLTLLIIEHDMDVALTVAERVTMMHDGRVVVEGTPAEIRASRLVHDLYLGSGYGG